jgi:hypothetical protein
MRYCIDLAIGGQGRTITHLLPASSPTTHHNPSPPRAHRQLQLCPLPETPLAFSSAVSWTRNWPVTCSGRRLRADPSHPGSLQYSQISFFFFLAALGFELRPSCLSGSCLLRPRSAALGSTLLEDVGYFRASQDPHIHLLFLWLLYIFRHLAIGCLMKKSEKVTSTVSREA